MPDQNIADAAGIKPHRVQVSLADADSFYREFIGYAEPDANEGYDKQRNARG